VAVSELEARRPVERVPPDQVLLDLQAEYRACEDRLNSLRRAGTVTTAGLMPLILELKQIQLQAHARRGPGKPPSRYATRPRLRNCERAGALRRFLIDQYGLQALSAGPVLDVAGGQGALAFEMANLNGLSVTVVDPRPLDLKRLVYKWR
jgi:2-polyprenyl-3-methyl-5-hydroxy-6-metoxy-1,4-benzoquinol methylase